MPCYDGRPTADQVDAREKMALLNHLNERTDQLCTTLKILELAAKDVYDKLPHNILRWHAAHKVFDQQRIILDDAESN